MRSQRQHQPLVSLLIEAQTGGRTIKRAFQEGSSGFAQGMGQRDLGVDPFQAIVFQGEAAKERRTQAQGMNGRAEVVNESRQR